MPEVDKSADKRRGMSTRAVVEDLLGRIGTGDPDLVA